MSTSTPETPRQRLPHLPIRTRRVIGGNGEDLVATTVYCALQQRSAAVSECEKCAHFHALHFDAATHVTSVACHCEGAALDPAEEAALRDAAGGPPDPRTPLAGIMTKAVICVRPDANLDDVMDLLVRHAIGGVPVVDADGRPVGIVSRTDVLRARRELGDTQEMRRVTARPTGEDPEGIEPGNHLYEPTPITAGEVMTPVVLALHESSNIGQAASLMAFEGVHRLPIVSDGGEVVGILSALDVLGWFGRCSGYLIPATRRRSRGLDE